MRVFVLRSRAAKLCDRRMGSIGAAGGREGASNGAFRGCCGLLRRKSIIPSWTRGRFEGKILHATLAYITPGPLRFLNNAYFERFLYGLNAATPVGFEFRIRRMVIREKIDKFLFSIFFGSDCFCIITWSLLKYVLQKYTRENVFRSMA